MSAKRIFDFVVIGSGTGALVTAASLRRCGKTVIRVGAPFPYPERLSGAGWCPESAPVGFDGAPTPGRAVLLRGSLRRLPLSVGERARLLPAIQLGGAGLALGRARVSSAVAAFVGGGREERTYRDWVRYRFGEPLYDGVFAPYARARFGDPEQVICGVARVVHGEPIGGGGCRPVPGIYGPASDDLDAVVTGLCAGSVSTEAGVLEGQVVVDLSPEEVLRALVVASGDPPDAALALDAGRLDARHGMEVFVTGSLPEGVDEVHVVGTPDAPFFRAVRHPGGEVALHLATEAGSGTWTEDDGALARRLVAAAGELGLPGLLAGAGVVRRLPRHHPVWTTGHLTRLRTWTEALVDRGIEPVGRLGLVAPMTAAAVSGYAEDRLVHGASLRDCIRHHVEPPPRDSAARPRLADFLAR